MRIRKFIKDIKAYTKRTARYWSISKSRLYHYPTKSNTFQWNCEIATLLCTKYTNHMADLFVVTNAVQTLRDNNLLELQIKQNENML